MKKILALVAVLSVTAPAMAKDPKVEWYRPEATGCMILRECKEDIKQVFHILDISSEYSNTSDFEIIASEFNLIIEYLNDIGIEVFLADEKYFGVGHRGIYQSKENKLFLNKTFMKRPHVLMSVMRHEGWHAAQDCMAGTIDNSFIALVNPEESVPSMWRNIVEDTYPKAAWPWEAEAYWAGHTEGMTMEALRACASDAPMWETFKPTPLTREWLIKNGYIQN
jgi:ABC-type uncharacterized transport system permease subunit